MASGVSAVVLLFCLAGTVSAENWTRFRGPNGAGIASNVNFPAVWTEEDYLWKIELPGIGHSSPVGWERQIFITTSDADSGEVTLHCFDAETGESSWSREFAGRDYQMHAFNSLATSTPTVDAERVYLTWADAGTVQCVALTHAGEEIWRTELGQFIGHHGFAASPIVVDGVVCVQVDQAEDGFLAGIDATSGNVRWRAERLADKATYATPCVVSTNGGRSAVISNSMSAGMQAIDIQSGDVVWQFAEAFPARCVSSPFYVKEKDLVLGVCGGGGGGKRLVGVGLAGEPTEKLSMTKQLPYVPAPLVKDDWMFLWHDRGKVSLADMASGDPDDIRWTKRVGGRFFGSPILAGDKIYCLSTEGRAVVIAASEEFELLGENDLGAPTNSTPAVHRGRMYLRTELTLACLPSE